MLVMLTCFIQSPPGQDEKSKISLNSVWEAGQVWTRIFCLRLSCGLEKLSEISVSAPELLARNRHPGDFR